VEGGGVPVGDVVSAVALAAGRGALEGFEGASGCTPELRSAPSHATATRQARPNGTTTAATQAIRCERVVATGWRPTPYSPCSGICGCPWLAVGRSMGQEPRPAKLPSGPQGRRATTSRGAAGPAPGRTCVLLSACGGRRTVGRRHGAAPTSWQRRRTPIHAGQATRRYMNAQGLSGGVLLVARLSRREVEMTVH
jgi:hypothetical protein